MPSHSILPCLPCPVTLGDLARSGMASPVETIIGRLLFDERTLFTRLETLRLV